MTFEVPPTSLPLPARHASVRRETAYRSLLSLAGELLAQESPAAVRERAAAAAERIVGCDAIVLCEARRDEEALVPVILRGREWVEGLRVPALADRAVRERRTLALNRANELALELLQGERTPAQTESIVSVPLLAGGSAKGAVNVYRFGDDNLFDVDGELLEQIADIAAQCLDSVEKRAELARLVETDPLTGLGNRRHFDRELARERARARRVGGRLAVLVLDVDEFKAVNDSFGHPVGDDVLRCVAGAIRQRLRAADVAARIGGDEFVLLLPGASAADATAVGEEVARGVSRRCVAAGGGREIVPAVSFGASDLTAGDDLFAREDAAMYERKASVFSAIREPHRGDQPS